MIDGKFLLNLPVDFQGICKIYSPKIKEIIENDNFSIYRKLLTLSQEEIEDEFREKELDLSNLLSPLEYLLNISFNSKEMGQLINNAFEFFIHEPIFFIYKEKKILIGNIEKELSNVQSAKAFRFLDENNFFDFQNLVRQALGEKVISPYNKDENPKIKRMKALARKRDKIKAKKSGLSFDTSLLSICCMGIGITPLTIGELSYATFTRLIDIYQEKEKYETDVKSLLAGASSKDVKLKYWIHNSEEN